VRPERRKKWRRGYVGRRANRPKTYQRHIIQSDEKSIEIEIEMQKIRKFMKRANVKAKGPRRVKQNTSYKENLKVNQ
jgi:hypothetical protein